MHVNYQSAAIVTNQLLQYYRQSNSVTTYRNKANSVGLMQSGGHFVTIFNKQ